jgi:hypothetical protein
VCCRYLSEHLTPTSLNFCVACSMRAEMKRDVLQLDTDKVKKLRLLGSGSFADVHESLLEVGVPL